MIIHRLLLIERGVGCINIPSNAYGFPGRIRLPRARDRWRRRPDDARRGRRRDRLHRPGAPPAARASSGSPPHCGDVIGRRCDDATAAGPCPDLDRRDRTAGAGDARPRGRHRLPRAPGFGGRRARADPRGGRRAGRRLVGSVPPARRRCAPSLVPGDARCARRRGLWTDRALPRRGSARAARRQPRLLSDSGAAGACAVGGSRSSAAGRHRRRRQIGRLGCRQVTVRAHAFFGVPRKRLGIRRLQSPARG